MRTKTYTNLYIEAYKTTGPVALEHTKSHPQKLFTKMLGIMCPLPLIYEEEMDPTAS